MRNVSGYAVTGNYFDLLGVQPQVGRLIHAEDEHGPNSAPYIVLSDSLWRSAFNADPGVVGTTVRLYKDPFTVIGVAPARFHGTERFDWPDYYIPIVNYFERGLSAEPDRQTADGAWPAEARRDAGAGNGKPECDCGPVGKGVSKDRHRSAAAVDPSRTSAGTPVTSFADFFIAWRGWLCWCWWRRAPISPACLRRARRIAAGNWRSVSLWERAGGGWCGNCLTEAIVLSMLGGTAGLVIAGLLLRVLNQSLSPYGRLAASVDARVYLAALFLTLVSALLFGMIPARQVSQSSPLQAMKSGSVDSTPLRRFTLRDLLLGAQIAICTLLVTASLVAVRGMVRMLHAPLGFQPEGAMLANIDLSEMEQRGDALLEKQKAMLEAVQRIPGVTTAGAVNRVPFTGGLRGVPVFPPGTTDFNLNNSVLAPYVFTMSPGYLEAAGTKLLSGRDISWHDTKTTPYVAIVNQTFARKMWGETPAIGQRFILRDHLTEVVGVAEDGKYYEIMEPQQPVVFLPLLQTENGVAVFVVRTTRAQNEMVTALERTLSAIEPNALIKVQSWPDAMAGVLFPARAASVGLGVMGLLAAMLAVTGIFGMAAYNVSRRMKELGIRVALGARTKHVMSAAVGRPIVLLVLGSLAGLLLGVFASRLLEHIVYQANPRDPVVVGGAVLMMVACSALQPPPFQRCERWPSIHPNFAGRVKQVNPLHLIRLSARSDCYAGEAFIPSLARSLKSADVRG